MEFWADQWPSSQSSGKSRSQTDTDSLRWRGSRLGVDLDRLTDLVAKFIAKSLVLSDEDVINSGTFMKSHTGALVLLRILLKIFLN